MNSNFSRRDFLYTAGAAGIGAATFGLPRIVTAHPESKVRVLSIGVVGTIGGHDRSQVNSHPAAEIVGLCDVDANYLAKAKTDHPDAFVCADYREAFTDHVDKFDFVIFSIDQRKIEEMGIGLNPSMGKCPDKEMAKFHRDMGKFSGSKLVSFVKWILENGETERYLPKKVSKLIADSIQNGFIKKDDLNDSIYDKVRPLLTK